MEAQGKMDRPGITTIVTRISPVFGVRIVTDVRCEGSHEDADPTAEEQRRSP